MFGVNKSTVTAWARGGDLPKPYDTLQLGRVWRYKDIEALADKLPTPHGRANSAAMKAHWTFRHSPEATLARKRVGAQNGNPSTGTSSSSETR